VDTAGSEDVEEEFIEPKSWFATTQKSKQDIL